MLLHTETWVAVFLGVQLLEINMVIYTQTYSLVTNTLLLRPQPTKLVLLHRRLDMLLLRQIWVAISIHFCLVLQSTQLLRLHNSPAIILHAETKAVKSSHLFFFLHPRLKLPI